MTKLIMMSVVAVAVSVASATTVEVARDVPLGPVKPVNGVGQPPMIGKLSSWDMLHYLSEAGIPYSRLHDVAAFGEGKGAEFIAREVKPQLDAYAKIGHTVRSMAYPNNRRSPTADAGLSVSCGIRRFRAGHVVKYDPLGKYPSGATAAARGMRIVGFDEIGEYGVMTSHESGCDRR